MVDPVAPAAVVTAPAPVSPSSEPMVAPAAAAAPLTTELGGTPEPAPAASEPKPGDPAPKPDAPVAFDPAKLTIPEGMKTDDPLFKSFAEAFGDDKLGPQERGQKLLDIYKDGIKAVQDQGRQLWETTNADWIKAVKADPEIGGAKFDATKTSIAKAIDSLGPADAVAFRQGLDATGAGNHPAIWKGLAKMAANLTEGGHVTGNPASKATPDIGSTFFPNSNMKGS